MDQHPQSPNLDYRDEGDEEPPVVVHVPQASDHHGLPFDTWKELFAWLDDLMGSESYGAPRVFDLYTMLAVTLAFALMFAFLRLIEPALGTSMANVALAIGFFGTLTAIAQLALFDGNKPRIASVLAGPPIWMIISAGFLVTDMRAALNPVSWIGLLCSSVLGFPAGYLGGAMVAGVFLLADLFRKRFMSYRAHASRDQEDATWDEIARAESQSRSIETNKD